MRAVLALAALGGCGRIAFDPGDQGELSITPSSARSNLSSVTDFAASGGMPPYTFTVVGGDGRIDAASGTYRAPSHPTTATIEVRDAAGDRATATLGAGGDYIYGAGGFNGTNALSAVYRSADGATWEVAGNLPSPRNDGVFVVFDDEMFFMGGGMGGQCPTCFTQVYSSHDGATWSKIGDLPTDRLEARGVVAGDRIYVAGGISGDNGFNDTLWSSPDGTTWRIEPTLPRTVHGVELVTRGDELWLLAGHAESGQIANIDVSLDEGATWTQKADAPAPGEYHGAAIYRDRIWLAGGVGLRDRVVSSTDGTSWDESTRLPVEREFSGMLEFKGELWVVGGAPSQPIHTTDGVAWSAAGSFPVDVTGMRFVQFTPH